MNTTEIVNRLKTYPGAHIKVAWERPGRVLKGNEDLHITKRTVAYVRGGIDYSRMACNEDRETQPLKWGNWKEFPYVVEHQGNEYIRLYPASFDNLKPQVEWLINGQLSSFEETSSYLQASEKKEQHPSCFVVNAKNIIDL